MTDTTTLLLSSLFNPNVTVQKARSTVLHIFPFFFKLFFQTVTHFLSREMSGEMACCVDNPKLCNFSQTPSILSWKQASQIEINSLENS